MNEGNKPWCGRKVSERTHTHIQTHTLTHTATQHMHVHAAQAAGPHARMHSKHTRQQHDTTHLHTRMDSETERGGLVAAECTPNCDTKTNVIQSQLFSEMTQLQANSSGVMQMQKEADTNSQLELTLNAPDACVVVVCSKEKAEEEKEGSGSGERHGRKRKEEGPELKAQVHCQGEEYSIALARAAAGQGAGGVTVHMETEEERQEYLANKSTSNRTATEMVPHTLVCSEGESAAHSLLADYAHDFVAHEPVEGETTHTPVIGNPTIAYAKTDVTNGAGMPTQHSTCAETKSLEPEEDTTQLVAREAGSLKAMLARATVWVTNPVTGEREKSKKVAQIDSTWQCNFCKRKGHTYETCPVRPDDTRNTATDPVSAWCNNLIWSERVVWNDMKEGTTKTQYWSRLLVEGEKWNEGNPWKDSTKQRDSLRKRLGFWKAMGADMVILNWLAYGIRLKFVEEPEMLIFRNHPSYHEHIEHVQKEHDKHMADGSYVKLQKKDVKVVNPLQVEENRNKKKRLCSDLRWVNAHLADVQFRMEMLHTHAKLTVAQGDEMCTTDIEQAYYAVPLHEETTAYLAWKHGKDFIGPTVLTFGLSLAPFFFTKIMRVMLNWMRSAGVQVMGMIDDYLWSGKGGKGGSLESTMWLVRLVLPAMGWRFNSKCVFTPESWAVFLGLIVDAKSYMFRAPADKLQKAWKLLKEVRKRFLAPNAKWVPLLLLQQFTGTLMSLMLAIPHVKLYTRGAYGVIAMAQETGVKYIPIADIYPKTKARMLMELEHWHTELLKPENNGQQITLRRGEITLNVDAGDVGWGGVLGIAGTAQQGEDTYKGDLPDDVLGASSTRRELRGLRLTAQAALDRIKGQTVNIKMDSYPAVCNLVAEGGRKEDLVQEVQLWQEWCTEHKITPIYFWVPREQNQAADDASKHSAASYEISNNSKESIQTWLESNTTGGRQRWWKNIFIPRFDHAALRITVAERGYEPAVVVLPEWKQAWWGRVRDLQHVRLGEVRVAGRKVTLRAVVIVGSRTKEENKPKWN